MDDHETDEDVPQIYLLGRTYLKTNEEFYIRNDSIIHMAAGDRHTIIVTETGRAYAFGDNNCGQLGLGHMNHVEKVSCIKSLKFADTGEKVLLAACGRDSSIVATNYGSLYAFGSNNRCQLGFESDQSTSIHPLPIKIEYFRSKISWKEISMGAEHTCALTDDGTVYIWGSNEDGQCGQTLKYKTIKTPKELRLEYLVNSISCGYYHTALVNQDGQLYLFGNNTDRQLGNCISDQYNNPLKISLPDPVKTVACGHQHTVVLTEKGDVYTCGNGERGQLGHGIHVTAAEEFELIENLPENIIDISAGEGHTAVIGSHGDVYLFGDGKHGKLNSKSNLDMFEPYSINKFRKYNVLKVVCGGCQTIILAEKSQIIEPFYSVDEINDSKNALEDNNMVLSDSMISAIHNTTHKKTDKGFLPTHPPIKSTNSQINDKVPELLKPIFNGENEDPSSTTSGRSSSSISSVPRENEISDLYGNCKTTPSTTTTYETLSKRDTITSNTDSTNNQTTTESHPGFFSRIFRPKPSQKVLKTTNKNSRTCSIM